MMGAYALYDWQLWINFIYFVAVVFFSCYLPGSILLRNFKSDRISFSTLSIIVGLVLWGLQGYFFGYLHVRWMTYVYLLVLFLFWFSQQKRKRKFAIPKIHVDKNYVLYIVLLLLGTLTQLIQIWFSGLIVPAGLYVGTGIDSVYHIALTQEIVRNFPPLDPGTVDSTVKNYHYFSNVIIAEWVRVFGLPLIATYFQYATVLINLLIGLSAYALVRAAKLSNAVLNWFVFFLYFSGSSVYLLIFLFTKKINISSIFLHDASLLWASPPRIYAIVVFLAGVTFLIHWITKKKLSLGIIAVVLFASLVSIKIYFGFAAIVGFGCMSLYFLWKRQWQVLLLLFVLSLVSAFLYIPVNNAAGGLIFTGLWRIENFIAYQPLGLVRYESLHQIYVQQHNFLKLGLLESYYFLLYFVGVFGTLLIGFFQTKKSLRMLPVPIQIFLMSSIFVCLCCGIFFVQQVGGTNSSQFIITVLQILPLYTAIAMGSVIAMVRWFPLKVMIIIIIVAITIPRVTYDTIVKFEESVGQHGYLLSQNELLALRFLNTLPPGVVLTPHYDCLYVRIFTPSHIFYCNDAGVLTDHAKSNTQDYIKKYHLLFYANLDKGILNQNNINYIYIRKSDHYPTNDIRNFKMLYQNDDSILLENRPVFN